MSTILAVYSEEPSFPATDQRPNAVRYHIGEWWVDAVDGEPTQKELDALFAAVNAPRLRLEAFRSDPDWNDLVDRLATATPAQVKTYVTNNVTDLASARMLLTKICLVLAMLARRQTLL